MYYHVIEYVYCIFAGCGCKCIILYTEYIKPKKPRNQMFVVMA